MQSNPAFNSLIEMGCNPILIKAAIQKLNTEDLSALLDWISQHSQQEQKWAQWLKENEGKSIGEQAVQGQSIEPLINKEIRDQLMAKGSSKNVAQKALLLTNNASIESAQKWIDDHKFDADFQQELRLQGQAYEGPKLSPEQAKAKLDELTKKARELRQKRQAEEAKQRQKNRVRYTKQMQEAKRIAQEQAMTRQIELDKIQKKKDEQYKKQLLEDMRRQKNARLGIKEEAGQKGSDPKKKQQTKLSLMEQLQLQSEQVKVGNHAYPDLAKTFFDTALIYVNNIIKNDGEEKFRKINKENKAFQNRICQAFGGQQWLAVLGYQEQGNTLVLKKYDMKTLKQAVTLLQRYRSWYS